MWLNYAKLTQFFSSTINQLTVRECSDKDEAIVRSAEQLSQHKVRNPDQTKPLFCSSVTVRTIERLGSMQTQHLFFGAVFSIKVLSVLLSFFLIDIKGEAFIFLLNLVILLLLATLHSYSTNFFSFCHSLLFSEVEKGINEACCMLMSCVGLCKLLFFGKISYTLKKQRF